MSKLEEYHTEFFAEATIRADSGGEWMLASMFEMFEEVASENGDVEALDYTPHRSQGSKVDGYHFEQETGTVTIAICDFRNDPNLQKLNASDITTSFKRAETFISNAFLPNYISSMEESSAGFQLAYLLMTEKAAISRIRLILFSNAELSTRLKGLENKKIENITLSYNVLDFSRFYEIVHSRTGNEPVEVDIIELGGKPLPFLSAAKDASDYEAYLLAIPGDLLAKIYSEYGARLLEQNVRTFLQARGKVNKGIQNTLKKEPEMFFAYNNGLTATASEVDITKNLEGLETITLIKNLQIVNGGQTTASMLYARDKDKTDLSEVFIQVKLSVISEERIEEVVPKISRFANTQNKVSEADFFSNHPFHVRIQEFSRRISAPPKDGQFAQTKWFYERARGQYKDGQAYLSDAKRKQFLTEFPRQQMFTKTDLAKYAVSFSGKPHIVSQGAQKNFISFAGEVAQTWEKDDTYFNEQWYRDAVAKAIIFKEVDKMVMSAEWYQGGYKANIVTYSIAWLSSFLKAKKNSGIDLSIVWNSQTMTIDLVSCFEEITKAIAMKIQQTPDNVRNVTEWCKKQACWAGVERMEIDLAPKLIDSVCKSNDEIREQRRDSRKLQQLDNEVSSEVMVYQLGPKWKEVQNYAIANRLITPDQDMAISRILKGKPPTTVQTKLLMKVLDKVRGEGFEI